MLAAALLLGSPTPTHATTLEASASPFTGDPLTVSILIDDERDPGNLVIELAVDGGGNTADLRGLFAHVADESLLTGLSVLGDDVSPLIASADGVINPGRGNNLNGGGSPCPCDLGIEIGSAGIGRDDIQSVTFTLTHATESLDVSLFDGQLFGVRATSVGASDGPRNGSSKLFGVVPEPTTAVLMMLGLAGLSARRR